MTMKQQMQSSAYPLKYADVRKLIVAAPNFRDRCVVKTLFWFGLRREELAELDIRDFDFERRRLTVRSFLHIPQNSIFQWVWFALKKSWRTKFGFSSASNPGKPCY